MAETHQVFRNEAVQRHVAAREQAILPRFARPPIFRYLWALLILTLIGVSISWGIRLPVYTTGIAVVVASPAGAASVRLFLPADQLALLHRGQPVALHLPDGTRQIEHVALVEPAIVGPAQASQHYRLSAGAAAALTQPMAVASAPFAPPAGIDLAASIGTVYPVSVEIGAQRVIELLPWVGQFFAEE